MEKETKNNDNPLMTDVYEIASVFAEFIAQADNQTELEEKK